MRCDECGERPARVTYRDIREGETIERNLCEKCAAEHGFESQQEKPTFPLSGVLAGLVEEVLGSDEEEASVSCPGCGMPYQGFRETGRLGCGECYEAFEEQLRPLLRRIHGCTRHVGKLPVDSEGRYKLKVELQQLKSELQRVVEREEFEEAAGIRDRIRALEESLAENAQEDGEESSEN